MATGYEPNVEGALVVLVDIMNANAFTMTRQPYEPNYRGLVDALIDLKEGFPVFSPDRVGFDVTTFEAVGDGDALYLRSSDGKAGKARANGGSDEATVIGFADTAASSGATVKCLVAGVLDYPSTINPGDVYFLSATPGAISTTPPSTTGHYVVRVGEGATATELSIQINAPIQLGNVPAFLYYTTASVSSFRIRNVGTVNYDVDWGDGSTETGITITAKDHTYSSAGVYTIKITPASGSTFRPEQYGVPDFQTNLTKVSGTGGSQLGTDLTKWLREAASLTSFDAVDTSSVTNFQATWRGCTGLTSFPSIDTSSATNFQAAWLNCTSLTTYPANQFNTTGTLVSTAFSTAFTNCALTAQSIENILTSLDTNGSSNITLGIDSGTNAAKSTWSTAANTAYNNLVTKGWTIAYNS